MKKLLLVLLLVMNINCTDSTTVYVCGNGTTKIYHFKANCRGLSNCTYKIIKTTRSTAISEGKTLCGWEN